MNATLAKTIFINEDIISVFQIMRKLIQGHLKELTISMLLGRYLSIYFPEVITRNGIIACFVDKSC